MAFAARAIIFDYYETLAELRPAQRVVVFDDLARQVGADLAPGDAYRHWRERTTRDTTLRLRGDDRPPLDGALPPFRSFREVWQHRFGELFSAWGVAAAAGVGTEAYVAAHAQAPAYPNVPAALDELRRSYRLAVLSDADTGFLSASIDRNALTFEVVVDSESVGVYKPHIAMFREVCARLEIDPADAVYGGDNPWQDIAGARNAGLSTVWVNRHGHDWPGDIEPPEAAITSLSELAELLAP